MWGRGGRTGYSGLLAVALCSFALNGRAEPPDKSAETSKPKGAANFGSAIQHGDEHIDSPEPQPAAKKTPDEQKAKSQAQPEPTGDATLLAENSRPVEPAPARGTYWFGAGGLALVVGASWAILSPHTTCNDEKDCSTIVRVVGISLAVIGVPLIVMGLVQEGKYEAWKSRGGLKEALNTTVELTHRGALLTHTFTF
jgi:hypothetical protein